MSSVKPAQQHTSSTTATEKAPSLASPSAAKTKRRGKKKGKGRKALGLTAEDGPMRMCIVCRASGGPDGLLRFARSPDGAVGFDVKARLPGRGAWVCAVPRCVDKASDVKHGGFARAFDAAVVFDGAALRAAVVSGLLAEVCERLGLLRRQGALIVGRDEVIRAAERFNLVAIGLAHDLSENSRHELQERAPTMTTITLPSMEQMGVAVGTRPVGVVGIPKKVGDRLVSAALRWAAFAAPSAAPATSATPETAQKTPKTPTPSAPD
jgi:predicted RNA-binding protein YlxR (DUF448 family)/ribosomal protein L7Ae-like RNA K-turn-binding protein